MLNLLVWPFCVARCFKVAPHENVEACYETQPLDNNSIWHMVVHRNVSVATSAQGFCCRRPLVTRSLLQGALQGSVARFVAKGLSVGNNESDKME